MHTWKPRNQLEPSGLLDATVLYLPKGLKKKGSGGSTGTETWGILFQRPWEVCESARKIGVCFKAPYRLPAVCQTVTAYWSADKGRLCGRAWVSPLICPEISLFFKASLVPLKSTTRAPRPHRQPRSRVGILSRSGHVAFLKIQCGKFGLIYHIHICTGKLDTLSVNTFINVYSYSFLKSMSFAVCNKAHAYIHTYICKYMYIDIDLDIYLC